VQDRSSFHATKKRSKKSMRNPIFWKNRISGFSGWYGNFRFTALGLLSRSASYYVSYSTPTGLVLYFTITTGFTCGYSYSTPTGLVLYFTITTGFTCGYSYSTPTGLVLYFTITTGFTKASRLQPLRGWCFTLPLPQVIFAPYTFPLKHLFRR